MHNHAIVVSKRRQYVKLGFHFAVSGVVIALSLMLFIYPAITICAVLMDSQLRRTGESRLVPLWFTSAAGRYLSWANMYLDTNYAKSLHHDDIAATEWPIFGSVFFLVTAEDLQAARQDRRDPREPFARPSKRLREIVASPVTATWVKTKWGDSYLEKENVFYRMLLILGLSSYERITEDTQYHTLMSHQRATLADELGKAKLHLRDDYPNECYPADMLWAVAAIQRAARLEDPRHDELAKSLIAAFDGPLKATEGLPAFQADSRSGRFCKGPAAAATRAYSCLPPNWTRRSRADGTTPTKQGSGKTPAGSPASREMPRGSHGRVDGRRFRAGAVRRSARLRRSSASARPRQWDGSTTRLR